MAQRVDIRVGQIVMGGREGDDGITVPVDPATQIGDVITIDTTGRATRGTNNALAVGVLVTRERDNMGAIQTFHVEQVVSITGAVTLGPMGLQVDGAGNGRLVPFGTAGSLSVNVLGSQVVAGSTFAAIHSI